MKKILIIGASILQLPAITKAKEMGMYVGVIDYNPNAVGVPYADEFFCVSTIDIEGVVKTAEFFNPDGIMTLATDMPMRSIAAACEKLGLPGITMQTAIKSTDKGEMIKAFEENRVEHPWYYIVSNNQELDDLQNKISFPCITKPTDNSGSRGVMLVNDVKELRNAVSFSSENGRTGAVIIEEYLQGQEVSVEIIVINGTVHVLQITDKLTTGSPHFVEMGHSQPSQLDENAIKEIKDLAIRAVMAVGIENGPAHVEIMLTSRGPKMIELGARMGGDCITTHLVPLSTGVDMIEATIKLACGETPDISRKKNKGSAIRYIDSAQGTITKIEGIDGVKNSGEIVQISILKQVGEVVNDISSSVDRIGFVIAEGDSAAEAITKCENAIKNIDIEYK